MSATNLGRASVIRTKNAGPFHLTIDVFFDDREAFDAVHHGGDMEPARVAAAYGVEVDSVRGPFWDEMALGVKVTIPKRPSSGDPSCTDILGGHLHLPLILR